HEVREADQVPEPDADEVLGTADPPRRRRAAAARLRARDDELPGELRAGALLARRAVRLRREERILAGVAERQLPADARRHVPASDAVLRRLVRSELGQQRPVR